MELVDMVTEIYKVSGCSATELGRCLGTTPDAVRSWMRGTYRPTEHHEEAITRYYWDWAKGRTKPLTRSQERRKAVQRDPARPRRVKGLP